MTPLLTPLQVAERLCVHRDTVYEMLRRGQIPAIKVGKQWRVAEEDLPTPYRVAVQTPRARAPRPVTGHFRVLARELLAKDAS